VFIIKSDYRLSDAGHDRIVEWTRSILPEGNRLKENLYTAKSMMKPRGYQKIDMCPNFCMLYYLENAKLTECRTCGHSRYKPRTGRGKTLVIHKKLRYFLITQTTEVIHITNDCWAHNMAPITWCSGWSDSAPFWRWSMETL